jgi:PAS domain S-box-containing protein
MTTVTKLISLEKSVDDPGDLCVLVVNDVAEQAQFVAYLLRSAGYRVVTAANGREGLEVARAEHPELVITDFNMPEMNGIELCRCLRADESFKATPILMMSSERKDTANALEAMNAGADDYLEVPYDEMRLVAKVTRFIERQQIEEALRKANDELQLRVEQRTWKLMQVNAELREEIDERERSAAALKNSEARFKLVLRATNDAVWDWELDSDEVWWNENVQTLFGYTEAEVGHHANWWYEHIHLDDVERVVSNVAVAIENKWTNYSEEYRFQRSDGSYAHIFERGHIICDERGNPQRILGSMMDMTDRRALEAQLRQAQKLESIGQLAAGIAHEINTPTQYLGDNIRFIDDAFKARNRVIEKYEELSRAGKTGDVTAAMIADLDATINETDFDYLGAEIPRAIQQSLEGIERIAKIVQSMKDFAHPGSGQKQAVDLNRAIESTITVARNEWKYVADLTTDFDPELPSVPCLLGQFNQVVLNIIVNAAHAITELNARDPAVRGKIEISTRQVGEWAEIRIKDTGGGIPKSICPRIFDPFFTTKPVGKGTGQGLAISHSVIVDKHDGEISFETETGLGTTFIIRLPLIAKVVDAGEVSSTTK